MKGKTEGTKTGFSKLNELIFVSLQTSTKFISLGHYYFDVCDICEYWHGNLQDLVF